MSATARLSTPMNGTPRSGTTPRTPTVADADQDAVAPPSLEPRRRGVVQAVRLEVDRPVAVLAVVTRHAAQQAATIGPRRLDQDGDPAHPRSLPRPTTW